MKSFLYLASVVLLFGCEDAAKRIAVEKPSKLSAAALCPQPSVDFVKTPTHAALSAKTSWNPKYSNTVFVAGRRVHYADLGDSVDYGRGCDLITGMPVKLNVLVSTGEQLSEPEIQLRRLNARTASEGKVSKELAASLNTASPTTQINIHVWHKSASPQIERPDDIDDSFVIAYRAMRRQLNTVRRANALTAVSTRGGTLVSALDNFPCIVAQMPAQKVLALAADDAVSYLDVAKGEGEKPHVDSAGYSDFYDVDDNETAEEFSYYGYRGNGVRVGIHENTSYAGLWNEHPAFANLTGYTEASIASPNGCVGQPDGAPCPFGCNGLGCFCRGDLCYGEHITQVASKMGSVNSGGTEVRNASRMHLYFASMGTKAQKLDWLASRSVYVMNQSETMSENAAHNYAVRENYITLAKSAGNSQIY
ncbi:MAG: hypothetical protein JRH20_21310, partial [Deltaproteobacteria bacterium]|nr:hypothetical protein [Deltaproteobacteria bacterium]